MRIRRLQHVSTPYVEGREDDVRAFYAGMLRLSEKPVPHTLVGRRLVWFEAGEAELELHFVPDPVAPDSRAQRHFCLELDDQKALEDCRRRLEAGGYETSRQREIPNRPRFFCRDPFGNLVEFTTITGDYRRNHQW